MSVTTKQPKVSILVPCYNVEKYLPQCLDSIVNQTLKDIEIICINDGSTDSTLNIINKYAKSDKRIKIIDKPNEGYGKSMNRGLDAATGEYIGIVESDDWVDSNMFEELVVIADKKNVDIVKSDFFRYTTTYGERNIKANMLPKVEYNTKLKPLKHINVFVGQVYIWSAIYKRKFLIEHKIRFLETPGASYQDTGFNFKCLLMCEQIVFIDKAFLHYRCDNENSSVKSTSKVFFVCDEWENNKQYVLLHYKEPDFILSLIPYLQFLTYRWNLNRLYGDAQQRFKMRFASDFRVLFESKIIDKSYFGNRSWWWLKRLCYPESVWYKIVYAVTNMIRPIYKTEFINGVYKHYLFGKIVVKTHNIQGI